MNFTARQATEFVGRFGADIIGDRLIPFLLMVVGFFPISISLVIALESFVGEKERRSIEPLLSSPLTDWHLYIGKLLAVIFPPLAASYLGIGVYLFGVYRQIGWSPEPILFIQILLLTFVQALVMVAGAVVISTQATSVRAANLLASFIIIPMAFLIQGESMVMFWAEYDALWPVVFGLAVLAAVLVRTGVSHFNREEMLGK
jgi:ABC-type Na+ efflux pump permease subunit